MIINSSLRKYKIGVSFKRENLFKVNNSALGLTLKDDESLYVKRRCISSFSGNVTLDDKKYKKNLEEETDDDISSSLTLSLVTSVGFSSLFLTPPSEKIIQVIEIKEPDSICYVNSRDVVALEKTLDFSLRKMTLIDEGTKKFFYYFKIEGEGRLYFQTTRDPIIHEVYSGFPLNLKVNSLVLWERVEPNFIIFCEETWMKLVREKREHKKSGIVVQNSSLGNQKCYS